MADERTVNTLADAVRKGKLTQDELFAAIDKAVDDANDELERARNRDQPPAT